jgi:hypothetical protein
VSDARLHLVPVRSREAKDFVRAWHRHHQPPVGQIFAVGAADESGTQRQLAAVRGIMARGESPRLPAPDYLYPGGREQRVPARRGMAPDRRPLRAGHGNDRIARFLRQAP